ncbi:MAG TPA: asparaginase domain-containing protein [Magnetovibrio sp.]
MKIGVINTGGTISCVGVPLGPMTAAEFAQGCNAILNPVFASQFPDLDITYVTDLEFPASKTKTLDSTNLQPTDWCLLADYILKHYERFDAWVVLHGTDSMDVTGTALPFLLSTFDGNAMATAVLSKPVILTGSQLPLFRQDAPSRPLTLNFNTDAFQNLCGAVAAAQTGIADVCVYFQNKLYRACRVRKTNATEIDAFSSPNHPKLGTFGAGLALRNEHCLPGPASEDVSLDNPGVRAAARAQLAFVQANIDKFPVMRLSAFPAAYDGEAATAYIADLIDACMAQGTKGLVLEGYGAGNFPSGNADNPALGAICKALKTANDAGVCIVDCTQVLAGTVHNGTYAAGAWLPDAGALSAVDMTPVAAFAKTMILLSAAAHPANGWSLDTVKTLVRSNLLGEMKSTSRLDSRSNASLLSGQSIAALDGSATLTNHPAQGPVLTDSRNKDVVLWRALNALGEQDLPGRLTMQSDGNLVFLSRSNKVLWQTNTQVSSKGASQLILNGSLADASLSLAVFNYTANTVAKVLYPAD